MDALSSSDILLFGPFRFDRRSRRLSGRAEDGSDQPVSVGSRALTVLAALTERPGDLVTKDEIMCAVWPGTVVEESNLTVQISALRRILDAGSGGQSCILTESGRGYRFVLPVTHPGEQPSVGEPAPTGDRMEAVAEMTAAHPRTRLWRWLAVGSGAITTIALVVMWLGGWPARTAAPPRLSLVVLPFQNLSGDPKDDYLADGITDDLTSDLSHIPGALVAARESAYTFKSKAVDVRQVGQALGVRYVLEGSVRRIEDTLRINVQLTSAETGMHLWSDRFDERIANLNAGQEQVVMRMRDNLGISLIDIESARSLHERPTNPDAFDLILRARAIRNLPPNPRRDKDTLALLERALVLDPNSVYALTYVAYYLADSVGNEGWGDFERLQRAERLLARARTIAPKSEVVLNTYVLWLRSVGRCPEAIEAAQQALKIDPIGTRVMTGIYNELALCKVFTGHTEEALELQKRADQLNPLSPFKYLRYAAMGTCSLWLGRDRDAITYLERSLTMKPETDSYTHWQYRKLAAAYARTGQMEEARQYLSKANRLWPYDTVRSHYPDDLSSRVFAAQIRGYQDGLRLAGERDHADEGADFGVPTDGSLHGEIAGFTPKVAPGAQTIRTPDLSRLLAETRPIVIDTMSYTWGVSIPGAVGLKFAGLGGTSTDEAQHRLRSKLHDLTGGDVNRPLVAVGWNSERFDGRNLALRLVALGYTRVYWYRGGREAWEVAGLPETEVDLQEW